MGVNEQHFHESLKVIFFFSVWGHGVTELNR